MLNVGWAYELKSGGYVAVTGVDTGKNEITAKCFDSLSQYRAWQHEVSAGQFPEWHKKHCPQCVLGGYVVTVENGNEDG